MASKFRKQNILINFGAENGHTFFTWKSESEFRVYSNREGMATGEMQIVEDPEMHKDAFEIGNRIFVPELG